VTIKNLLKCKIALLVMNLDNSTYKSQLVILLVFGILFQLISNISAQEDDEIDDEG
jgi:hypothetical protein